MGWMEAFTKLVYLLAIQHVVPFGFLPGKVTPSGVLPATATALFAAGRLDSPPGLGLDSLGFGLGKHEV